MIKLYKKIHKYFSSHPMFNGFTHLLIGIGAGILVTYPLVVAHPVRWGLLFIGLGVICHLYPLWVKK